MRSIALVNQKGGVGKSTTAVNLSAGLARLGKRVLLIDLDPQAHSTVALGLDPRKLDKTVYTLLSGQAAAGEVIRPVSAGLSIIPSNIHLAGGEPELSQLPEPAYVLQRAMAGIDASQYDYAIVDCSPQLGFLNVNCLVWVREVYIPVTCEFYALHGLSLIMDTVERLRVRLNPELAITGVITCQVHPRRAVTRDVLAELEKHFPGRVLRTRIRVNVRLVEAPSHGKPIFDYAPDSNGAADYMSLAQEVVEREALVAAPTVEAAPPLEAPVIEAAAPAAVEPEPAAPVVEAPPPAAEPEPEPVVAEVAPPAEEPAAPVVESPTAPVEAPPPFVALPEGAPLTTPVAPAPAPSQAPTGSTPYAEMLGLGGLKPIVVARPGGSPPPPTPEEKGTFGKRLLGKLMGRKI